MTRPLAAAVLLSGLALAAPVPKAPPKTLDAVFGVPAEGNGVTLEMTRREELRASVPKDAAVKLDWNVKVRPLATRTVDGDFELTVRVTHSPPADKDLASALGGMPSVAAGLALFPPDNPKCSLTLFHKHTLRGGWRSELSMSSQHDRGGSGTGRQSQKLEDQPLYLRLVRKGDEFRSFTSADGKAWQPFGTHKAQGFGGAVVVGPAAAHNTTGGYEVTFDEYNIKPLTEEKK